MAESTTRKKFTLDRTTDPARLEKLGKYEGKLEKLVKQKVEVVNNLQMIQLEDRVFQDQELTDNTASDLRRIWRSMKTDDLTCSLSRETATLTTNNLDITDALSNQKLALIQTNSAISDENICVKSWKILSNPLANQPDIKLKTSFKTIQSNLNKGVMPSINCVRFKITGLDNLDDLAPAISYCQDQSDIQLFSRLLEDYITLNSDRNKLIQKSSAQPCIIPKASNILEFRNSESKAGVLVYLVLGIGFDENTLGWAENWCCKFTELGRESAQSCNIPDQLLKEGKYKDWSVTYAIETLSKMASLDAPTPQKQDRAGQDSLSVSDVTPLNSECKRAPKRRLASSITSL